MKHLNMVTREPVLAQADRSPIFDALVRFLVNMEVEKTRKATPDV